MKQKENTQLHSNGIQEIFSKPPGFLISYGVLFIVLSITIIVIGSCFIQIPQIELSPIMLSISKKNSSTDSIAVVGVVNLNSKQYGQVREGQNVNVKLAAYPYIEYGYLEGRILSITDNPQEGTSGLIYEAVVYFPGKLKTNKQIILPFSSKLEGVACIIVKEKRVIHLFRDAAFPI